MWGGGGGYAGKAVNIKRIMTKNPEFSFFLETKRGGGGGWRGGGAGLWLIPSYG